MFTNVFKRVSIESLIASFFLCVLYQVCHFCARFQTKCSFETFSCNDICTRFLRKLIYLDFHFLQEFWARNPIGIGVFMLQSVLRRQPSSMSVGPAYKSKDSVFATNPACIYQ